MSKVEQQAVHLSRHGIIRVLDIEWNPLSDYATFTIQGIIDPNNINPEVSLDDTIEQ